MEATKEAPIQGSDDVENRREAVLQRREEMRQKAVQRNAQEPAFDLQTAPLPNTPAPVETPNLPGREDRIRNALEFLQDPRVASAPADRKRKFLASKGLSEEEIDEAFAKAGQSNGPAQTFNPQPPAQHQVHPQQQIVAGPPRHVIDSPLRSLAFALIACASIGSTLIWLFKKYFWTAKKKPQKKNEKAAKAEAKEIASQHNAVVACVSNLNKLLTTQLKANQPIVPTDASLQIQIEQLKKGLPKLCKPDPSESVLLQNYSALKLDLANLKNSISGRPDTSSLGESQRAKPANLGWLYDKPSSQKSLPPKTTVPEKDS